jgi:hypothetical protein
MGLNCRSSATGGGQEPSGRERPSPPLARVKDQARRQGADGRAGRNPVTAEAGDPEKAAHLGIPPDHEAAIGS